MQSDGLRQTDILGSKANAITDIILTELEPHPGRGRIYFTGYGGSRHDAEFFPIKYITNPDLNRFSNIIPFGR